MPDRPAALSDAALLARLVAFDSTSRNSNLPLADFLCGYLDRPGIRVRRNPSAGGDKVNLIFEVGPEQDPEQSPGLPGRGSSSLGVPLGEGPKSPAPAVSAPRPKGRRGNLTHDQRPGLVLSGHMDVVPAEEMEWESDPFSLVDSCPEARALPASVVIGEPTGLRVVRAHKGHMTMRITLHGRSAHSGYP